MLTLYPVNVASLQEHFPPNFLVPSLLLAFADWVRKKPWGSLGDFRVESSRWNDYFDNGCDLYAHFAMFLRDSTGGLVGFWLPAGKYIDSPPVVYVGSEGELQLLGHSLEDFFNRLARSDTQLEQFDNRESDNNGPALNQWLASHGDSSVATRQTTPDFVSWWNELQNQQEAWCDQDPIRMQLADRLRQLAPPPADAEAWWTANFDVLLVGSQFRMWHRNFGPQVVAPTIVADLETLIRMDRERRARRCPERGLWFLAWVTVLRSGGAHFRCEFLDEPRIGEEIPKIPNEDYQADLLAFPRSPYWMPKWLEQRLHG